MRRLPNVGLLLGQRLRWPNSKPTLAQRLMFVRRCCLDVERHLPPQFHPIGQGTPWQIQSRLSLSHYVVSSSVYIWLYGHRYRPLPLYGPPCTWPPSCWPNAGWTSVLLSFWPSNDIWYKRDACFVVYPHSNNHMIENFVWTNYPIDFHFIDEI